MPVPSQLRFAASRVYRNGGYGDVYWNESTGGVFYCTGDWYPSEKVASSKAVLAKVPGVTSVEVESECRPSPSDEWVKVQPVSEVTTSGGVGGFQSAVVGSRKMRDRAARFHDELKKALGQLSPDDEEEVPESIMPTTDILSRIDRSIAALTERHDNDSGQKYDGYWIAVSVDTQRSDGKPYFVSVYEVDPRDNKPGYSVYKSGVRTAQQAITWARGEISRGDIPFARHDDMGNPIDESDLSGDAAELRLFIDNDSDLYRQQFTPMVRNLMTKIGQGRYDRALAVKLFMYLVDAGAQKYAKQNGGTWNLLFPKKVREQVATAMRDSFETEAALGNYNDSLPAKYASTDVAAILRSKGFVAEAIADNVSIEVGSILVSTWGYEQTNVDFYKVLEVKGDYAKIVQIGSKQTSDGAQSMTGRAVPNESITVGAPMRRKIKRKGDGGLSSDAIRLTSYSGAYPWDGKPVSYSSYG